VNFHHGGYFNENGTNKCWRRLTGRVTVQQFFVMAGGYITLLRNLTLNVR
jgi:hypothetical protein